MPEPSASLLRIARIACETTDLTETLRLICRELAGLMHAETVSAYLLDQDRALVRPVAAYHVPKEALDVLRSTTLAVAAQGFSESVFVKGRVAWSDDVQRDPRFAFPLFHVFPHQSGLIIPLALERAVAGAFYIVWWRARREFGDDEVNTLETVGQLVALVLKSAQLARVGEARRRSAEAVEARYRLLFERNLAGVLWTDASGRVVDCNESLARILGYDSRADVLGRNARDFYVDPGDRARVLAGLQPGGTVTGRELHWRRRDGRLIWLRVNLRAADNGLFEGILIDISDEKRLAKAEREAVELRAIAKLAAAAAHEINNPLAVVVGHLSLLRGEASDNPRVAKILDAAERIRDIVERMTRITRVETLEYPSSGLPPMLDIKKSSGEDTEDHV